MFLKFPGGNYLAALQHKSVSTSWSIFWGHKWFFIECEGLRPQRVLISPVPRLCFLYGIKTESGYGAKPKIGVDDYNGTKGILAPCPGSVSFTEQRPESGYGAKEKIGTDDDSRTKTELRAQRPSLSNQ